LLSNRNFFSLKPLSHLGGTLPQINNFVSSENIFEKSMNGFLFCCFVSFQDLHLVVELLNERLEIKSSSRHLNEHSKHSSRDFHAAGLGNVKLTFTHWELPFAVNLDALYQFIDHLILSFVHYGEVCLVSFIWGLRLGNGFLACWS
jgi:hypothetical protein